MLFNSWIFFFFLLLVLPVYYCLSRRAQNVWLLAASYIFYGWWDWRFLGLIFISTLVDYVCGLLIDRQPDKPRQRKYVWISCATNLGILGVFKYYDFFVHSMVNLLSQIGFHPNLPFLEVILPVGISFYTFQTLSYTIDIYRGKLKPCRDFLDFSLFVAFYPQLVAGPIERARHLIPQIQTTRIVNSQDFPEGCHLILLGLFKKVAIADTIAPQVDLIFTDPSTQSTSALIGGVYLFAIQIYGDFSGYSDIARGLSKLHGFDLMENFNQPYFARSITEFWRRWHISLSTWLRDYLYIPLGGNRCGKRRMYLNLMITMVLGGLWHGASWRFVAWGGLHGIFLAVHKMMLGHRTEKETESFSARPFINMMKIIAVFHLVCLTWIYFRASSFSSALVYIQSIFTNLNSFSLLDLRLPLLAIATVCAIDIPCYRAQSHTALMQFPAWIRVIIYVLMTMGIMLLGGTRDVPFIYFQF